VRTLFILALILGCLSTAGWSAGKPGESTGAAPGGGLSGENTISLEALVKIALEQNPSVQAARQAAEAKKARIVAQRTLPDPTVSFETMGDPVPFRLQAGDPSSGRTFSLEQEIPFPGKLDLKGKIAEKEAAVRGWSAEQTRLWVVRDLKRAYYDYFFLHKSREIVEENKGLLDHFAQAAEARYRVGQGTQQDVLRAQVEISKLMDRMEVLEQRRVTAQSLINSLLHRSPEAPLGKPEDVALPEVRHSLEELQQLARNNSPALRMQEQEIERNQHGVELARRDYYPDFSVGFSYVDRDREPEMYGVMVKAKLPLYYWRKQRPELDSARLNLASSQRERESAVATLAASVRDAYTVLTASNRLAELYKSTVIPQASLALESALASYQVGQVDFLRLLDGLMTLLEYQLKYFESVTESRKALAQLEPLVGIELTL